MVGTIESVAVFKQEAHVSNELRNRFVLARLELFSYWSHNTSTNKAVNSRKLNKKDSVHRTRATFQHLCHSVVSRIFCSIYSL